MSRKIYIVLSIVLSCFLGYFLWNEKSNEEELNKLNRELQTEILPYNNQINSIENEIYSLEEEISEVTAGTATTQFMVNNITTDTYDEIIAPLSAYGYPTALCLTLDEMPGDDGCISLDTAYALQDMGFYFCYFYDVNESDTSSDALSSWLNEVKYRAENLGITMSNTIILTDYSDEYADVLKEHEINVVVKYLYRDGGSLEAVYENELWNVETSWWRNNSILTTKLDSISETGGEIVIVLGIDHRYTGDVDDWMSQYMDQVSDNTIETTDFSTMSSIQFDNLSVGQDRVSEIQEEITELNQQKQEINDTISEINQAYAEKRDALNK